MKSDRNTHRASIEPLEPRRLLSAIVVEPVSVTAPTAGESSAMFMATTATAPASELTVGYYTTNGSAKAGVDYGAVRGSAVIAGGQTSATFSVPVLADDVFNPAKFFVVHLWVAGRENKITMAVRGTILDSTGPPKVTLADATVKAGTRRDPTFASVRVALSNPSWQPIIVHYSTVNDTAIAGVDFRLATGAVRIKAGANGATIGIKIIGGGNGDRVFNLAASSSNASVGQEMPARVVIGANAAIAASDPTLSAAGAAVVPGSPASFVLSLSAPSAYDVSVRYQTENAAEIAGGYDAANAIVTIPAGQISTAITIGTLASAAIGTSIGLNFSSAANAVLGTPSASATFVAPLVSPPLPALTVANAVVAEPTSSTVLRFTVTLSAMSTQDVAVTYQTAAGTALAGTDYQSSWGTLTVPAGSIAGTIDVPVFNDAGLTANRELTLLLTAAVNATIANGAATGTIIANAPAPVIPTLSIAGASVTEPVSGTAQLPFAVTLSAANSSPVTVAYATADGTAIAGTDYQAASGTLTFEPGTTSKTVNVTVYGGIAGNSDKTLAVQLRSPSGATVATGLATGTIVDDVTIQPTLSVTGTSIAEPASGTGQLPFKVTLSAASTSPVTVGYATADGTAAAGADYQAASGTVTFAPGEIAKTVNVTVYGGITGNAHKTLTLKLSSPVGATIATSSASGTIVDDIAILPTLSIAGASVTEPAAGSSQLPFAVTLSAASTSPVTVAYATSDGTAVAGTDYQAESGTLTFAPGTMSKTVNVTVFGGIVGNSAKTLTLTLSAPSGAAIGAPSATGTIRDDITNTGLPVLSVSGVGVDMPISGTTQLPFTVTLSEASPSPVTVAYATSDLGAIAGVDYQATSGTLSFAPGTTSEIVNVTVYGGVSGDAFYKTLLLTLSSPSGATIGTGSAIGDIVDIID